MKEKIGSVFAVLMLLGSCQSSDQPIDKEAKIIYTQDLSLSLEADVVEEDGEVRVAEINFLGQEDNGKIYPKLDIPAGTQTIPVHTAIANATGTVYGAKTVNWIYTPASNGEPATLTFPTETENITLTSESQFVPGNETFYVTAVIDGSLVGPEASAPPKVTFAGNLDLKGITNAGENIPDLKAPFAMPWTKLKIYNDKVLNKNVGSSRFSAPNGGDNYHPKFRAQGSFIGIRLENQTSGILTPKEILLRTHQFGYSGSFDLRKPVISGGRGSYPAWTFDQCAHAMGFSFNNGTQAANIASRTTSAEVYYTWVMPNTKESTELSSATVHASSTGVLNTPLNDFWRTSYTGAKKPLNHTSHQLKLAITESAGVSMPIEDFTDYNIAGGDEYPMLQYLYDGTQPGALQGWVGRSGRYRLTASRLTIHSGMYNHYMVMGERHDRLNPNGHDLENLEVKAVEEVAPGNGVTTNEVTPFRLGDKYYIPSANDYAGLIPSGKYALKGNGSPGSQEDIAVRFGGGSGHPMLINSQSEYTELSRVNDPQDGKQNLRFYALRFKDAKVQVDNAACTGPRQFDLKLSSAFRYTYKYRKGISGLLEVDVVYLGTDASSLQLADLENQPEVFWTDANQRGDGHKGIFVKSVGFPAVGDLESGDFQSGGDPFTTYANDTSKPFDLAVGHYYSRTPASTGKYVVDWANGWDMTQKDNKRHKPMPVRVFKKAE